VDALITSRDGIVGPWKPETEPAPLEAEIAENLALWGPRERASLCHFELLSRIGFKVEGERVTVQHLQSTNDTPQYQDLITIIRPTPEIFRRQLDYLDQYTDLRPDRAPEILAQLGHPTPFLAAIAFLDPARTRWTLELLYVAIELAYYVVMRVKHGLACRRPHEYSPQVQPIIPVPLHGTFPSGHATEASTAAFVLCKLISNANGNGGVYADSGWCDQLMRQAARIAINRTVAGLHFPVDSAVGAVLGLTLGQYFASRCTWVEGCEAWEFDGSKYPGDRDFFLSDFFKDGQQIPFSNSLDQPVASNPGLLAFAGSDNSEILKWLWDKAVKEWKPRKKDTSPDFELADERVPALV
jgi:hypothetical protein